MRVISDAEVQTDILPRITLSALLQSQAVALHSIQGGAESGSNREGAQCPARLSLRTPRYTQLFMPARTHTPDSVVKIVSVPRPGAGGVSGIHGVNLVLDDATGRLSHVVDSTCLTALRTAAGSLASSILALGRLQEQVGSAVVFGDGAQAVFHVWLHMRYFAGLREITVVVGSHKQLSLEEVDDKQQRFATQLESLLSWTPKEYSIKCIRGRDGESVTRALQSASLVFTCTPSSTALFAHSDLAGGPKRKHICAVGSYTPSMCELPRDLICAAAAMSGALVVDSAEACATEAGCLLQALPSAEAVRTRCVELGALLPKPEAGGGEGYVQLVEREARVCGVGEGAGGSVTSVFKSVGVGVQDVEITKLVVSLAGDVGVDVAF
ncbi:hypothetical protein EX895_005735 [Sporisorium graminicola]|uniref:Ornithine cyclodeaminase n=1 Tax=Sporisorium graminicola TaxID=280036 RepID=A0A4U7KN63_9BASI|nr:hypothetical protein EX895_005735 [Sporisorium graminicola]TKY85573.1 hypothetical protein EX895_005735 [Sporisorium graminicola]